MSHVVLFDTTLRDGSQRANISFSVADKIKIAHRLDSFGIHYIEGGWPGSNPKDEEFFRAMRGEVLHHAKLVAFSSTCHAEADPANDINLRQLIDAGTETVCIFGKSWDYHVTVGLGTTLLENLRMIEASVRWLREQGRTVIYDAEHFFDGYTHNPEYALASIKAAERGGAAYLTLCDTNGGNLPPRIAEVIRTVREHVKVPLGIHAHDDSGVGVANSLAAVQEGAVMVQGTINGYGERCGNANLVPIIANLQLKMGYQCVPELPGLSLLSHYVAEIANLTPQDAQPFVGRNAFTHKAGVHASAVIKSPCMYEHVEPSTVGSERRILVSELAGKSNLLHSTRHLGISAREAKDVVAQIKGLEYQGYQFEGAEASLELLVRRHAKGHRERFRLEGFRVIDEKRGADESVTEATIKVRVGERLIHTAAEGNGPVNALDNALRKALETVFPSLARVKLLDYKVRVLAGSDGTGARVRVLIESGDGLQSWGTVGVSTNIIEASWQALVDSVEYALIAEGSARAVSD